MPRRTSIPEDEEEILLPPQIEDDTVSGDDPDEVGDALLNSLSQVEATLLPTARPVTYRAVQAGSDSEIDKLPVQVGEKQIDFHKLFRAFKLNTATDRPYNFLGSVKSRAVLLGWREADLKSVEMTSRIYEGFARKCPGLVADIASRDDDDQSTPPSTTKSCPCAERFGFAPNTWKGQPCPTEVLSAFRNFVKYVRELNIRAEDHVDIQQVAEIVKLQIYEARCDEVVQADHGNLFDVAVGNIDQKNSIVYWNKVISIALTLQEKLSKRRLDIYKDLIASRADKTKVSIAKLKAESQAVGAVAALDYASAASLLNRENIRNIRASISEEASIAEEDHSEEENFDGDVLDADFTDEETESEENDQLLQIMELNLDELEEESDESTSQ